MSQSFHLLLEIEHLRGILLEDRLDFLRTKFVPLLQHFLQQLYTSGNRNDQKEYRDLISFATDGETMYQPTYPDEVFRWIISLDPTPTHKFSQWLLTTYLKHGWQVEDGGRLTRYLTVFDRVQRQLPVEQRDLNRVQSMSALYDLIGPFERTMSQRQIDRERDVTMHDEARVMFNNSEYKIVVPMTEAAACHFGMHTQWCTAAETDNAFETYHQEGDIYIILEKKTNKRWQFHFETQQFMDENDNPISTFEFCKQHPVIGAFFEQLDQKSLVGNYGDKVVYKTSRGIIVKDIPGITGHVIAYFATKEDGVTVDNNRIFEYNMITSADVADILNGVSYKGDPHGGDIRDVYYRNDRWGTITQVGKSITKVAVAGTFVGEWKVIEQPRIDRTLAIANFQLVDGSNALGYKAVACAGNFLMYSYFGALDGDDYKDRKLSSVEISRIFMPLIRARTDFKFWNIELCDFDSFSEDDKKWLLENRPTLCTPAYAFEHMGATRDTKLIVSHWVTEASNYPYAAPITWSGDKAIIEKNHNANMMYGKSPAGEVIKLFTSRFPLDYSDQARKMFNKIPFVYRRLEDGELIKGYDPDFVDADYVLVIPIDKLVALLSRPVDQYKNNSWVTFLSPAISAVMPKPKNSSRL